MNRRRSAEISYKPVFLMRNPRIVLFFVSILLILICVLGFSSFTDAHTSSRKYYASVYIESGDSLWSIAGEYMNHDFDSYDDYIEEIKRLNHLSSDVIHEGCYLIIPYESTGNL